MIQHTIGKPRPDGKPLTILDVLVQSGLAKSRSEGKRLIKQGGVTVLHKREKAIL